MMRWKRKALWSIRSCGIFTTKSPTAKCEKMLCMHLLLPSSTNRRGRTIPSSFGFLPRLLRCSDHHSFPGGCLSAADTQPAPQPGYLAGTGMGLILCNMILRPPVGSMCPYDFLEQFNGAYYCCFRSLCGSAVRQQEAGQPAILGYCLTRKIVKPRTKGKYEV